MYNCETQKQHWVHNNLHDYHVHRCALYGERAQGGAAVVTIGEGKMGDMTTCAHDSHVNCYIEIQ